MGKKSHKETTTVAPPSWAVGPLQSGMNQVTNTVNANQGNLNALSQNVSGLLPGLQSFATDTSQLAPGQSYLNDVLGGKYLNANPYTTALTQQAGNDAANHINATFSMAGRTGGANHAIDLAKGVDQAENAVLFQNYQNERASQNSAASQLPDYRQASIAGYAPYLAAAQLAGQLPYYGIQNLGVLGQIVGNNGTTNATKPGGWGNDVLNFLSNAASNAASAGAGG